MKTTSLKHKSFHQRSLTAITLTAGLLTLFLSLVWPSAQAYDNNPIMPSSFCNSLQIPKGNKMAFYVYALGVQVYRWNGTNWVFVEPLATLFAASYLEESPYATPTPLVTPQNPAY
jgi:hypothetical protein